MNEAKIPVIMIYKVLIFAKYTKFNFIKAWQAKGFIPEMNHTLAKCLYLPHQFKVILKIIDKLNL
ncbi:hypothetical protein BWI96_11930 [Siphonobacter sp. SORGH_AS_0500]|nr:hypothetical protein BWI96_11930 [Siphonobacter sp. SORGH_AS_0500]